MARDEAVLTVEEFQLHLYDVLSRDLRSLRMSPPPNPSKLKSFDLHISKQNLTKLYEGAELDSRRPYIMGKIEKGQKTVDMEVRLRGQRHWHNLGRQKSLKIRLPKGKLINGYRIFNLINDPMPIVVGEELILGLAREFGVLTPESSFVRVSLNGADLGVMRYETQPDEGLLRSTRLAPGSIYSGNLPGSAKTEELWQSTEPWRKSAWRIDPEENTFPELDELLTNLRTMSIREFTEFARSEMDLKAFATFDALVVAFGSDQHDFRENHKLHFDPHKGRWQPVAWNFRGFQHDPYFNLTENPFLLRFKMIPEYVSMRNRILYEMLVGDCSVQAVHSKGRKMLKKLAPELVTDRYFDAYKLLTRIDRFHRQMVRPMNLEKAALVFESELTTYRKRHSFLMRRLKENPLFVRTGTSALPESDSSDTSNLSDGSDAHYKTNLEIIVDGRTGVSLKDLDIEWPDTCEEPGWRLIEEGQGIQLPQNLYPVIKLIKRKDGNAKRGNVRTAASPAKYEFTLESTCKPNSITAIGTHLATGSLLRSRDAPDELMARIPKESLTVGDLPTFEPGEVSPPPLDLRLPAPESITLGPGLLEINETRRYGAHQSVEVAPGTTFRMAKETSLIFMGPVSLRGTATEPIVIVGSSEEPWGGIALQGPGTAGSILSHVKAHGGSTPKSEMLIFPGMVNIHDTKKITIEHCDFGGNRLHGDVLHATYVKKLVIEHTRIIDAVDDAFDLEFVEAELRALETHRAGDDAMDLMGAKIRLSDSVFIDSKGNAISAGEESEVKVFDVLIAGAKVGVLAKNASDVHLTGTLLWKNEIGLRVYKQRVRYTGDSFITSDVLYVVGSVQLVKIDKDSPDAIQVERIQSRLPTDSTLDHLRDNVLEISKWSELKSYVGVGFMLSREKDGQDEQR